MIDHYSTAHLPETPAEDEASLKAFHAQLFGFPSSPLLNLLKLNHYICEAFEQMTQANGLSNAWSVVELKQLFMEMEAKSTALEQDIASHLADNQPFEIDLAELDTSLRSDAALDISVRSLRKHWQPEDDIRDEMDAMEEAQYFMGQLMEAYFKSPDTHEATDWSLFTGGFIQWKNWMRDRQKHVRVQAEQKKKPAH